MDKLQNYGSDSNSSVEDEDTKNQTHQEAQIKRSSLHAPGQVTDLHAVDFLGLSRVCTKSSLWQQYNLDKAQEEGSESRKFSTSSGEVEVPSGEFWQAFLPDSNTDVSCQTSHSEYYNVQTERGQAKRPYDDSQDMGNKGYPKNSKKLRKEINLGHSLSLPNSEKRNMSTSLALPQPPHSHGTQCSSTNNSVNSMNRAGPSSCLSSHKSASEEKRKLFYIHSKTAPYLNFRSLSKCPHKLSNSWPAHDSVINRLSWNVPNFSHLLLTAGMDSKFQVWSVWSSLDPCVAVFNNHKKAVKHCEWCQSGRKVLSCSYDRTAQVTDVETASVVAECEHIGYVTAGRVHPSNPNLFATGTDNMILMWDQRIPQAPVKHLSYKDKFGQIQDVLFIADGRELVSCSDMVSRDSADRGIMAWDLRSGVVLSNQIFQERYTCTRLKLHPGNNQFLAQTHGGYIALFSTSSPYKMDKSKRYGGHKMQGYSIGFDLSADGTLVYSGSAEGGVHCYDQHSGRLIRKLSCSKDVIIDVACHPILPSVIASCTWGGSVSLWS